MFFCFFTDQFGWYDMVFYFCSRDLNIILITFWTSDSFACHWVEILCGVLLRILWESPGEITLIAVGSNWSATPFHIYLSSLPRHTKVTKYQIVNHYYFSMNWSSPLELCMHHSNIEILVELYENILLIYLNGNT